mgnify:CR=1 FL=1
MGETTIDTQPAIKLEGIVQANGHIDLPVPFAPGKRVVVFVIQQTLPDDLFGDLLAATTTSLDFWNNPLDDAEWNHA